MNFLRNISGYVRDCVNAGMKPSLFQAVLFGEAASTVMCPPFLGWMPDWLLFPVHRGLVWVGEGVLG